MPQISPTEFTRYRFACIRFSPTSRCTTSGRLTYLRAATALPFLNFFAGRVRAMLRSTDFRQWPARLQEGMSANNPNFSSRPSSGTKGVPGSDNALQLQVRQG
jgi:hypothetical protein